MSYSRVCNLFDKSPREHFSVNDGERAIIKERQREGIAVAKGKGVYRGRKSALTLDQVNAIRQRAAAGERKATLARARLDLWDSAFISVSLHLAGVII